MFTKKNLAKMLLLSVVLFSSQAKASTTFEINLEYFAFSTELCGDEVYTYYLKDYVISSGQINWDILWSDYSALKIVIYDDISDSGQIIRQYVNYYPDPPWEQFYEEQNYWYEENGDLKIKITSYCENAWFGISKVGECIYTNPTMKVVVSATGNHYGVTVKMRANVTLAQTPVQVSVGNATCTEGSGESTYMNFAISRNCSPNISSHVYFHTDTDITAVLDADYNEKSTRVDFAPFERSKTVAVKILDDNLDEYNETFSVKIVDSYNATIIHSTATGTIVDNDSPPKIVIECDTSITEGDIGTKPISFMIQKIGATAKTVSVTFETTTGTAVSNTDYEAISPTTIEFAPNESQKSVNCYVKGDYLCEGDENFYFDLSDPVNATLSTSRVTVDILDNDADDVSLPVQLSSFSGELVSGRVQVKWATQSETDNLGFILERANDYSPLQWNVIASYETHYDLRGQGNSSEQHEYTFVDEDVDAGQSYIYRLSDVNTSGVVNVYDEITIALPGSPAQTVLEPPFPNPFNPETRINYQLAESGPVEIVVYNLLGRKVRTLVDENQSAGSYNVYWHGDDAWGHKTATGTYLIVLKTAEGMRTQKVVMVR